MPKHEAENVPEPERPEISVTVHWKFAQFPGVDGAGDVETHVPSSELGLFDEGPVGLPEQAAPRRLPRSVMAQRRRVMGRL